MVVLEPVEADIGQDTGYITPGYHRETHNCSHLHIRTTNYPDMHVWTVRWMWTIPGPSCCEAIVLTTTPQYRVVFIVSTVPTLMCTVQQKLKNNVTD